MSMDEDQASYRDSLDLSSLSTSHADPEQDGEQDGEQDLTDQERAEPPMLPDSEPPDDETEKDLSVSLAELNVNQSNNNVPCSPILRSLSGIQLTPLCGKKLPLTRNRDSQPEFVWYHHHVCVWGLDTVKIYYAFDYGGFCLLLLLQ